MCAATDQSAGDSSECCEQFHQVYAGGGSVSVRIQEEPCKKEGWVSYRFEITDTGIGMSEEYLPHIFEEFTANEPVRRAR